jgi:hypothetical protein
MKIHLHIERLVLDGIPVKPGWQTPLIAACRDRLVQLLSRGGIATGPRPDAGGVHPPAPPPIRLDETREPDRLGQSIAQSVYGSIKP